MAQCQVEGGGTADFEQILPTDDLLAIYQRITQSEIKVGLQRAFAAPPRVHPGRDALPVPERAAQQSLVWLSHTHMGVLAPQRVASRSCCLAAHRCMARSRRRSRQRRATASVVPAASARQTPRAVPSWPLLWA